MKIFITKILIKYAKYGRNNEGLQWKFLFVGHCGSKHCGSGDTPRFFGEGRFSICTLKGVSYPFNQGSKSVPLEY